MLKYFDTPVIEIIDNALSKAAVRLFVKREDQNHPFVSGNKWWKLKYNLEAAKKAGYEVLLTFGGAFSNHIYATAAAAKELGFKSIGIIRGEEVLPLNQTLAFAKNCGMQLHYISRETYRKKTDSELIKQLEQELGRFYLIPEGGTNEQAIKGCAEFVHKKLSLIDFDYLCLPVGTGGTMAGIIAGLEGKGEIVGFSVLKNGDFLNEEIKELVKSSSGKEFSNWHLKTAYHFGGYAKHTKELQQLISQMKQRHDLWLDQVYTAKMIAGVYDLISKNYFLPNSKILALHTGGLRN